MGAATFSACVITLNGQKRKGIKASVVELCFPKVPGKCPAIFVAYLIGSSHSTVRIDL